jgi:hypothetical protein
MATAATFPEVKRPERETDHSPPSCSEVKNEWSYTSTLPEDTYSWNNRRNSAGKIPISLGRKSDESVFTSVLAFITIETANFHDKSIGNTISIRDLRFSWRWRFKSWYCGYQQCAYCVSQHFSYPWVWVTLRLTVCQSVRLGIEPLWDSWPDSGYSQDILMSRVCLITGHSLSVLVLYVRLHFTRFLRVMSFI